MLHSGPGAREFKSRDLVGLAEIEGKWAYAVGFVPISGDRQIRYFDSQSFLLVRLDLVQRMKPAQNEREYVYPVETYFSQYQNVQGISVPRKISSRAENGTLVLEVQGIEVNGRVDDQLFQAK